ncbi:hypothetical protein CAL12_16320 [Bordetella genomosp. 8]|uniref:Poly(3-hydroxybutyrate) depolymerase n=1 Tax=Bordetella genomosp. 8 TaxID=1416806 RepID=A0A1W6YMK6_9BORD|nr:PHB depolymerase family esterase [Bordetella genomosp. 8]ARP82224.1 hypothetical protein CAL12_16320 [Bordetella genomosp. 8]
MNIVRQGISILAAGIMLAQPAVSLGQGAAQPAGAATRAVAVTPLNIDATRIAVAGISSGAYMAVQAQIAYPDLFARAGVLAGGPYQCAEDSMNTMIQRCMAQDAPSSADIGRFVATTLKRSQDGSNGPLDKLKNGIVYMLHGTYDTVVLPAVAESAVAYYTELKQQAGLTGLSITDDKDRPFGHTFPTALAPPSAPAGGGPPTSPDDCKTSVPPYLGHCGFDAAKAILDHLYPEIDAGKVRSFGPGTLQQVTFSNLPQNAYMENWAYLYTPAVCGNDQACGLVVALHGCNQNYTAIKDLFAKVSGFDRWAATFRVAILYPQTQTFTGNYGGCWDWWGYTNADYDTRKGVQLQWIATAVQQLGGPAAAPGR